MFRAEVLEHYGAKGYQVHEKVKVRGRSGAVYAVDMVAQGPLGNLVVSFGDEGGIEAPELSAIRRIAKDIGAAAVIAARHVAPDVQRAASENGVMVLDGDKVGLPALEILDEPEAFDHPWPEQGFSARHASRERSEQAQTLWHHKRSTAVAEKNGFAWLTPGRGTRDAPARSPVVEVPAMEDRTLAHAPAFHPRPELPARRPTSPLRIEAPDETKGTPQRAESGTPSAPFPWRWVWGPAAYGAATIGGLIAAKLLFF